MLSHCYDSAFSGFLGRIVVSTDAKRSLNNDGSESMAIVEDLLKLSAFENKRRASRLGNGKKAFNVFDVMAVTTDEVNGHSRFLHHLLSPKGSHGMGDAFLQAFFKHMPNLEPQPWLKDARVSRELAFEDGRLDLLIELSNTCCVVIEVKIFAADQHRQLERYGKFIEQWKAENPSASVVREFYLTLDGHEASDYSVGSGNVAYECLSFDENILPWLETCIDLSAQDSRVSEAIRQYAEIVRRLSKRAIMDEEMTSIVDKVSASRMNYEAAVQVADSLRFARTRLLEGIFRDIESYLADKLPEGSNLTTDAERVDVEKYYLRNERKKRCPMLKFKLVKEHDRVLAISVALDHRLWVGLTFFKIANNEWGIERIDDDREWLRSPDFVTMTPMWESVLDKAPAGDWWLDWRFIETQSEEKDGCIDFRSCSSSEYSALFDDGEYEAFIKGVHFGIDSYLAYLETLGLMPV